MGFNEKVVLITGGSSGIGADAAIHLAKLGANVSIVGRNAKRLEEVAKQIKTASGRTPLQIVADVTKDAKRIVDETIKQFGKLDVLVNNAGISIYDTIQNLNLDIFDRLINTNLRSVVILTHLCIPHLAKTKGNIVNISSIAGLRPIPLLTGYSTSKAAVEQFSKCCAVDLAEEQIRVNVISPGMIRTPIFGSSGASEESINNLYEKAKNEYLVRRVGEVSDTSAAIAFLADNEQSSFLTGISIPVDGGSMIAGIQF